jgi:glycosyltransferase involved in cell wall biosynthesis
MVIVDLRRELAPVRESSDMAGGHPSGAIRVTHLVTDLGRGGAEVFLQRLVSLPQADIQHRVISLTTEGELGPEIRAAGVDVAALSLKGSLGAPFALTRLVGMLRDDKPDVLMTWLYHADFLGTVATALGSGPQLVWNIRCADMDLSKYGYVSRALPHVLARMSRRPAAVVANSEAGRQIHERYGYGPRRWEILPNGFDMQTLRPDATQRAKTRAALGIDRAAPVVGLFARFDPMKDHATFLAAAEIVAKARPETLFLLAGRGTDSAAFDHLVGDRPDLRARLILLGERRDMPELMAATDIAVCSSLTEGFPNTIGEAMASGVPCVSTDVGDAALLIGDTGGLVPKADPAALAHKLEEFLDIAPEAHAVLGAAARRRIEERFSLNAIAARYAALFRELT